MNTESTIPPSEPEAALAADSGLEADVEPEHETRPGSAPLSDPGRNTDGIAVEVSDTQSHLKVNPEALARLVRGALRAEGVRRASVSVAVVDDVTIREVNRRHLDHDWPTDVISFGLSDPGDPELSGALIVSAEMASTTAGRSGAPAWDELALYVVHGLLHLCGHDDATDAGRAAMRRREGEVLAALGLSNTFAAAATWSGSGPGAGAEAGAGGGTRERKREAARWLV
jgi:probable rRNA maturation factor